MAIKKTLSMRSTMSRFFIGRKRGKSSLDLQKVLVSSSSIVFMSLLEFSGNQAVNLMISALIL